MERKTGSVKRHYYSGEDTIFCPGHSCALFRACSQPKNLCGWRWDEGRERAALCSLLPVGCSVCYKAGTRVFPALLCPKGAKNCEQAGGWRRAVWWKPLWRTACCRGSPTEPDAESFPAPAVSSDSPGQSTDTVSWNLNLPTWCPHQQGLQRSHNTYRNCPVELIFASVRFKNTFLDPHVICMNTPTFFSVPAHRNDDFLWLTWSRCSNKVFRGSIHSYSYSWTILMLKRVLRKAFLRSLQGSFSSAIWKKKKKSDVFGSPPEPW